MHNKLRQLRRARNLTLAQVAQELGTTPQTVSRLENEVITLSTDWLERFGALFDVDPAHLLGSPSSREIQMLGQLDRFGRVTEHTEEPCELSLPAGPAHAVKVTSVIGPYGAGDILLTTRLYGDDMTNAVGHDALVGLSDGSVLLRRLVNGREGHYMLVPLISGEDIQYNVALDWAGRIMMRVSYF